MGFGASQQQCRAMSCGCPGFPGEVAHFRCREGDIQLVTLRGGLLQNSWAQASRQAYTTDGVASQTTRQESVASKTTRQERLSCGDSVRGSTLHTEGRGQGSSTPTTDQPFNVNQMCRLSLRGKCGTASLGARLVHHPSPDSAGRPRGLRQIE